MPGDFIPVAEESELIDRIGEQVLSQACADAAWWASKYPREHPFHITYAGTDPADADSDGDGLPDPGSVPFVCGPTGTWTSGWTAKGSRVYHDCDPFAGDKCNPIKLSTSNTIPYYFAPVIGINTGSTGVVNAASCKGSCGAASSPIDVVMVLDRTGSMDVADVANVQNAALSVLDVYDPAVQWVGMVSLPYGQTGNKCVAYGDNRLRPPTFQLYPDSNYTDWQAAPLDKNYKRADGTINTADPLVQQINCLTRAGKS